MKLLEVSESQKVISIQSEMDQYLGLKPRTGFLDSVKLIETGSEEKTTIIQVA